MRSNASTLYTYTARRLQQMLSLQEIVWRSSRYHRFAGPWAWIELQESVLEMLVNLHDGSLVTAAIAVVWRREDRYHVSILRPVVPVHDQLMSSRYQSQAIIMVECLRNVLAKRVPCTARRDTPAAPVIWVRP